MKDEDKTKEQLIEELEALRKNVAEVGKSKNERKQVEERLRELYEQERKLRRELEVQMRRRIEFTRALVHEIKTPLTSVVAASDLLAAELKEEPWLSLARHLYQGACDLNHRIDELLDLARGEIGMLRLRCKSVDPVRLLHGVANNIAPEVSRNAQSLLLNIPPSLNLVWADGDRLRQVVLNLLSNALKFTPEGGKITLKAGEKNANLIVEVQDTGPGIAKEDQQRLFEPYHRLESDRERLSGLGLGLALSKMLVELHGGQIWMKSEKGKGSTFGFSVPLRTPKQSGKRN